MSAELLDDILQPLPLERYKTYRNECVKHHPSALGLRAHHFLFLQERWARHLQSPVNRDFLENASKQCILKVYAHRSGDARKCTFVAITESGTTSEVSN